MATLIVPRWDPEAPWPTLGPQVCDLIEQRMVFGPGSLKGEPAVLDQDKRGAIYSFYEVYPQGHEMSGMRRYKRCGYSVRKGLAKTELGAWVANAELHPEGPVRCDGFDAHGEPVGRPVRDPYIPLLAVTVEQVEELMYGALYTIITEGPDADMFDASLERIIRLSPRGRPDGKAVPLSNSPGARDGARTTFQAFDEPHRLFLPRQLQAHETMVNNLDKRIMEDPWGLYVGTAGEPGQGSIAENLHGEAESIARGDVDDPELFYFYRGATPGTYNTSDEESLLEAIKEATGPVGEWGRGQYRKIANNWKRKGADKRYLERVWLNVWVRSDEQAFDVKKRVDLLHPGDPFKKGELVTAGFDGARFRDSTGIVLTHVPTGIQKLWAGWELPTEVNIDPLTGEPEQWEIDPDEVSEAVDDMMRFFEVWRFNCDPPHYVEQVADWSGKYTRISDGKPIVEEWWTNNPLRRMAYAVKNYHEAIDGDAIGFLECPRCGRGAVDPSCDFIDHDLARHYGNAGRKYVQVWDEDPEGVAEDPSKQRGQQLHVLRKIHPDRKFDYQMAAILSHEAYLAATKKGATKTRRKGTAVRRL